MARYNTVQIDGIYLTRTGASDGTACKVDVTGLLPLRLTNSRIVRNAIDGTPKPQFRSHLGKPIGMVISQINTTGLEALIAAINDTEGDDENHAVTIEGDTGNFDLDCVLESMEAPGTFLNGEVNQISLQWRIAVVNSIEEPD